MDLLRSKNGAQTDPEANGHDGQADERSDETEETARIEKAKRGRAPDPRDEVETEKQDIPAMLFSAFLVFLPAAIVALFLICLPIFLTVWLS